MTDLAALVARRLCHDFAGPIGAIATAVDMLGSSDDAEVRVLIGDSIRGLSASLRLYRTIMAPGVGTIATHDAKALLLGWVESREDISLGWTVGGHELANDHAALLLGLALVAGEALARGGDLHVGDHEVVAKGTQIRLDVDIVAALAVDGITSNPRAALARVVAANAATRQLAISVAANATQLTLGFAPNGQAG